MAFNISYILQMHDKYSKHLEKFIKLNRQFTTSVNRMAASNLRFAQSAPQMVSQINQISGSLRNISTSSSSAVNSVNALSRATRNSATNIRNNTTATRNWGRQLANLQTYINSVAARRIFAIPTKDAMEFEDAMIDVVRVTNLQGAGLAKLRKTVIEMAPATGRLPVEMATLTYEAAKLGIANKNMSTFLSLASRAGVALDYFKSGGGGVKELSTDLAKGMELLGLPIESLGDHLDAVNYLVTKTAATGTRTNRIIRRIASSFAMVKMPYKEIDAFAAFADRIEVSPQKGAKGLQMMIREMERLPGIGPRMIAAPTETILKILDKMRSLPEEVRGTKIIEIFGANAGEFVKKASMNVHLLRQNLKLVGKDSGYAGSMTKELEKKLAGALSITEQFKMAFKMVSIELGTGFLPVIKVIGPIIKDIGGYLAGFFRAHPIIAGITMAIVALVAGIATLLPIIGSAAIGAAALSVAFGLISWPILGIVAGVIAIIAAFILLRNYIKQISLVFDMFVYPLKIVWDILKIIGGVFIFLAGEVGNALLFFLSWINPLGIIYNLVRKVGESFGLWGGDKKTIELSQNQGGQYSPAAQAGAATSNNLSGYIEVAASKGSEITGASFQTDFGDMGYGLMGA